MNRFALTLILVGAFILTASNAAVKLAGAQDLSLLEISFARFFMSVLCYLPFFLKEKTSFSCFKSKLLLFRGFVGFIAIILNYYAAMKIELGNATLLNLTSPIFTFLLAPLILKEHIPYQKVFWLILAIIGVLFITPFHIKTTALGGYTAGLASGFCAASAYMTIRKLHERESFITISFTYSIVATILCLIASFFYPLHFSTMLNHAPLLILVGFLGTLYQGMYTLALRYEKASKLAPLLYLSVLTSFGLGYLGFGELITLSNGIGTVLVIVALIFLTRERV